VSKNYAEVNKNCCVACGACTKQCPKEAISIKYGCYSFVDSEKCVGCGRCAKVCPAACIIIKQRGNAA
jgi:ferredoxin